jgi:hypothetical protein
MVGGRHKPRSHYKLGTPSLESLDTCASLNTALSDSDVIPLSSKILFLAYFGGYALLPRQFRQERDAASGAYRPVQSDTSISHGQSTPLLAEGEGPS